MLLYNAIIQMSSQVISLYRNIILILHLLALMLINLLKKELACSWKANSETLSFHSYWSVVVRNRVSFTFS